MFSSDHKPACPVILSDKMIQRYKVNMDNSRSTCGNEDSCADGEIKCPKIKKRILDEIERRNFKDIS